MGLFTVIFVGIGLAAWRASCHLEGDVTSCYVFNGERALYLGSQNHTAWGNPCLNWADAFLISNTWASSSCAQAKLENNFCRDPDSTGYPWCMTNATDPTKEKCDIPSCPSHGDDDGVPLLEKCFVLNPITNAALYEGNVSTTLSGKRCQRWMDQLPQLHVKEKTLLRNGILRVVELENFCRDPDREGRPWCYTTDPKVRWEYCNVSYCAASDLETNTPDLHQCYVEHITGHALYLGDVSTTTSGRTCQAWEAQEPHVHTAHLYQDGLASIAQAGNLCQDFDSSGFPWCYTTSKEVIREKCPVPACALSSSLQCFLFKRSTTVVPQPDQPGSGMQDTTERIPTSAFVSFISIAVAFVLCLAITVALIVWFRRRNRKRNVQGNRRLPRQVEGHINWINTHI